MIESVEPVGCVMVTVGLIRPGLLLMAVTVTVCPRSPIPSLMPVRLTTCWPAFSRIGAGLVIGSSVGCWLTGRTTTTKLSMVVFWPPLAVPPLSIRVRVIRDEPLPNCVGA